ncbi:FemAB family XrtA/PEP-CTERM system-associated protein [Alteromonas facilis]|uniref:FemAB family XrtA/PEP-CTERM system-associated protein n=1 Tax=Alteromonas facilis TaxID=2048004 RepID=UPI000C286F4C|nr:FemAB family XrtA/PEP-CTERM system-associated protein [Alteromonas facilis]
MNDNKLTDNEILTKKIKQLKNHKGEIAGQFKNVPRDSEQFLSLKREMQAISEALKDAESKLKNLKNQDKPTKSESSTSAHPPLPEQFNAAAQTLNCPLFFESYEMNSIPDAWWTFIKRHSASFYHSKAFMSLLQKSLPLEPLVMLAFDENNEIVGGLPLFITDSAIFGRFATSIPHVNYGGSISHYKDVCVGLMQQLPVLCNELELKNIQVRSTQKLGDWPASEKKVSMLRVLQTDIESFNRSIGAKVRAQAKKAEVMKPTIKFGSSELLNDFYRVFSQNMRDLGTPVYAKQWFNDYLRQFPENSELCVGYVNGAPVSCGFLIYHKDMAEIPWASTLRKANAYDMNMWTYRQILLRCIEKKCRWFDFGRSTADAGTFKFKKQWGAKPVQHYWYDTDKNGFKISEGLNPDNPKFKLAITIWQRLPLFVTNLIGPMVAKDLV